MVQSVWRIPQWHIGFDLGALPWQFLNTPTWFITHAHLDHLAALPLLLFLFAVYGFVLTPVENTITRTMEAEADNYGLNVSRQPDGFAQAAMHLSEYRKMQPGPVEEFVFYNHPSGWNRIHRAMVWKVEHLDAADIAAYGEGV